MSAAERGDEDAFVELMSEAIGQEQEDEPVNLAAERQNPAISWDEFAGNYT